MLMAIVREINNNTKKRGWASIIKLPIKILVAEVNSVISEIV